MKCAKIVLSVLVLFAWAASPLAAATDNEEEPVALSVATFNVANFGGFPAQKGSPGVEFFVRTFKSTHADVLALQECSESVSRRVAKGLGWHIVNFPGGFGSPHHYGEQRAYCSGAIVSRYPIADSKDFSKHKDAAGKYALSRHLGRATIAVDGHQKVMVYGTHMWPYDNVNEAQTAMALIKADKVCGVPQLLLGDLNARPESPVISLLQENGFVDASTLNGSVPALTSHSDVPTERIDYVFVEKGWSRTVASAEVVMNHYTHLKDKKTQQRVASDHMPVVVRLNIPFIEEW